MLSQKLYKTLGGFNTITETINISGGFTIDNVHVENSIVIGDITSNFIKNKIIEWDTFKSTYYKDKLLDPNYYNKLLNTLNNIYILPTYTTNENDILYMINTIYNSTPIEIINGILKNINIFQPLKLSIKHLFMIYKVYIEKLIEIYVNSRNLYVSNIKDVELNNFNELTAKWNIIDAKNNIDTSSPILFFNFPPSHINLEKSIPRIIWTINSNEPTHKKINNLIDKFLTEIKNNNFEYVGYCPNAISHRFQLLLKFPVNHLINIINELHNKTNITKLNRQCDNSIILKIDALSTEIEVINKTIPSDLSLKHKKTIKDFDIKKFPSSMKVPQKIKCFEQYIKAFIQLYTDLVPYIIKKEKCINKLAVDINTVSNAINNLTDNLTGTKPDNK